MKTGTNQMSKKSTQNQKFYSNKLISNTELLNKIYDHLDSTAELVAQLDIDSNDQSKIFDLLDQIQNINSNLK